MSHQVWDVSVTPFTDNVFYFSAAQPNILLESDRFCLYSMFTSCCFLLFFFFPEYSEAVPGLPTSYAAILRIKSGSSSLTSFNSKNRPRLSSPSLGSVSSPGWRGAAQHYYSPTNLYHFSETFKHDGKCSFSL